jgi:hypothetical protein
VIIKYDKPLLENIMALSEVIKANNIDLDKVKWINVNKERECCIVGSVRDGYSPDCDETLLEIIKYCMMCFDERKTCDCCPHKNITFSHENGDVIARCEKCDHQLHADELARGYKGVSK